MGDTNIETRKSKRRPKNSFNLATCSAAFLTAGLVPVQSHAQHPVDWDDLSVIDLNASNIYPEDWAPGDTYSDGDDDPDYERFLHDWSYAGYYYGERGPYTNVGSTYDVTDSTYNADNTGLQDATDAIQSAIDDAGNAGGGIVYLPAGTYRLNVKDGERFALWLNKSNVILRGDGENTKLYWANDRNVGFSSMDLIRVSPYATPFNETRWHEDSWAPGYHVENEEPDENGDPVYTWVSGEVDVVEILEGPGADEVPNRSTSFMVQAWSDPDGPPVAPVDPAGNYAVGDWVILRTNATAEFAADHGMSADKWEDDPDDPNDSWLQGTMFLRQITAIDEVDGQTYVTINVPTRYYLKSRDDARMYKVGPLLQNVGIEDLQISAEQVNNKGHSSLITVNHTVHSWVRNIKTYQDDPTVVYHIPSNGINVAMASFNTFDNLDFGRPQDRAGGGNGYLFTFRGGGENLLKNSKFENGRHNISFANFYSNGNVVHNTVTANGAQDTDFHRHLSMANLFDMHSLYNEYFDASKRASSSNHGHSTTQTAIWNTREPDGSPYAKIRSHQRGWGYVIGTTNGLIMDLSGSGSEEPDDHREYLNTRENLWPQSLYLDQFRRRMERGEYLSTLLPYSAFNNTSLTNTFDLQSSDDFGGLINAPTPGTWYYETKGGSVTVAEFPSATDKSLLLKDRSIEESVRAHRLFKERSSPILVEFKVYLVTGNSSAYSVWDDETLAAQIKINSSSMGYIDGSEGNYRTLSSSANRGRWYDFKMIVDPETDTADYYLDGSLVAADVGLANGVDSVNRFSIQTAHSDRGALYFDDLVIKNN